MHAGTRVRAVALALLVVLSGCSALGPGGSPAETASTPATGSPGGSTPAVRTPGSPAGTPTSTPTATPTGPPETVAVDGELPVNATLVFHRVERLFGVDVRPPTVVVERTGDTRGRFSVSGFDRVFGLVGIPNSTGAGGYAEPWTVHVVPNDASAAGIESVLAHEFAHAVAFRLYGRPSYSTRWAPDELAARRAVSEGVAQWVERMYERRYLGGPERLSEPPVRERYANGTGLERSVVAPYYWGLQYVRRMGDSPGNLPHLYDPKPSTTEVVIHGLVPGSEPPLPLRVSVDRIGAWRRVDAESGGTAPRQGELRLRVALRTELNRSATDRAATGWGTDGLLRFSGGDAYGVVWVFRWDTGTDAAEARTALKRYADRRAAVTPYRFRVRSLGNRTLALVAGNRSFVTAARVTGSGPNVSVSIRPNAGTSAFRQWSSAGQGGRQAGGTGSGAAIPRAGARVTPLSGSPVTGIPLVRDGALSMRMADGEAVGVGDPTEFAGLHDRLGVQSAA